MKNKLIHSFNHSLYHRETRPCAAEEPDKIKHFFYEKLNENSDQLHKTHLFHGRYENIYLKDDSFKPLTQFQHDAIRTAAQLLKAAANEISMDFWFNDMPPGHITDWHRHDVMDERLSGVYYIFIPKHSGNLLLKDRQQTVSIIPKANDFVFFEPQVNHFVEENQSNQARLSIGMNFGFKSDKE